MVWDIDNIKVSKSELALLQELQTVAPGSLVCSGSKYRTAKRLRDRNMCMATSPEAPGGAAFRLGARSASFVRSSTESEAR